MERKVVVTNLEQKESNLEKDQTEKEETPTTESILEPKEVDQNSEIESITSDALVVDNKGVSSEEILEPIIDEDLNSDGKEATTQVYEINEEILPSSKDDVDLKTSTQSHFILEKDDVDNKDGLNAPEFYSRILDKAKHFTLQTDWSYVSNELGILALRISEGPEPSDEVSKEKILAFNLLRNEFEEKKKAHYVTLNNKTEENLVAKKNILKQFSHLINEKRWTDTKMVNQLKDKWESIKFLPQQEVGALNKRFESLLQEFENHKVDRLVKKLQQEEQNLTLKLVILEKMKIINGNANTETADFQSLNTEFADLIVQWRKIGRVPSEKNQETWNQFNLAQGTFNELRFKHDKQYRESIERALSKKKKLIEEAESLMDGVNIADAARRVNQLHKAWKKTENLPKKEENELWDKFKTATDSFNDKKTENIDQLREEENKNLLAKQILIQQALDAQSIESYDQGHKIMQRLMGEWKKIGPVPRKKSSKVWKQFKKVMDGFYNQRREHFKSIKKNQKDHLTAKKEIIQKLTNLAEHEDATKAVDEAKILQAEFKKIGHVPLKFKNKIWKDYREICDKIYGKLRTSSADLGMERRLASEGVKSGARKEIIKYQKELELLRKKVSSLESDMIQYEEAQTYFKPTNKGNKLRNELQSKIDNSIESIAMNKRKISELAQKINMLKSDANDE